MNKVYVGLDLASSTFQQAVINDDGVVIMNRSFPTSEANLRSAFANPESRHLGPEQMGLREQTSSLVLAVLVFRVSLDLWSWLLLPAPLFELWNLVDALAAFH